jgi:hypothetical protein
MLSALVRRRAYVAPDLESPAKRAGLRTIGSPLQCPTSPYQRQRAAAATPPATPLTGVSTSVSTRPSDAPNRPDLRATGGCDIRNHNPKVVGSSPTSGIPHVLAIAANRQQSLGAGGNRSAAPVPYALQRIPTNGGTRDKRVHICVHICDRGLLVLAGIQAAWPRLRWGSTRVRSCHQLSGPI